MLLENFIVLRNCSTCFGHSYAHHQEPETILVLVCGAWCQMLVVGWQVQGNRLSVGLHLSLWSLNLLPCTCQPTTGIFGTTHRTLELI
jgi:hypothetical protein